MAKFSYHTVQNLLDISLSQLEKKFNLDELFELKDNLRNLRHEYDYDSFEYLDIDSLLHDVKMIIYSK